MLGARSFAVHLRHGDQIIAVLVAAVFGILPPRLQDGCLVVLPQFLHNTALFELTCTALLVRAFQLAHAD